MYKILSQEERDFLSIIKPYTFYDYGEKLSSKTPDNIKDLYCLFRIKGVKEDPDGYVSPDMRDIKELYCSLHSISYQQYDDFFENLNLQKIRKLFNEKVKEIIQENDF